MRILLTALAALEVAALIIVGTASAATAPEYAAPAPSVRQAPPAPAAPAGPVVCGEEHEEDEALRIAAEEISRLDAAGYPVCEVTWRFTEDLPDYLGLAYDDRHNTILMNTNEDVYTQAGHALEPLVRHVVRHEFGHQITFVHYPSDLPESEGELAYLFTGDRTAAAGYEISADTIAAALGDDAAAYEQWKISLALDMLDNTPHL